MGGYCLRGAGGNSINLLVHDLCREQANLPELVIGEKRLFLFTSALGMS